MQRLVDLFDSSGVFPMNVDPSLCDELKQCKNHLLYLAELCLKFNEVQKCSQGVTIIQALFKVFKQKWRYKNHYWHATIKNIFQTCE